MTEACAQTEIEAAISAVDDMAIRCDVPTCAIGGTATLCTPSGSVFDRLDNCLRSRITVHSLIEVVAAPTGS